MSSNADNPLKSIQEPQTFIKSPSTVNWFWLAWSATAMFDFWNEMEADNFSTSQKGIFDPCPEGWKTVPGGASLASEWNLLPNAVTYYDNYVEINDILVNGTSVDLGIWLLTGYIDNNSGTIVSVKQGSYWTGTHNTSSGYEAFRTRFVSKDDTHPSISFGKSNGLPIRCMRRVDK
ncbi:MAG: fibrobacter succinogenes major paralogous domain-containing protein [Bacteroides sp.]|nr:fibrobacter succinogenes major paralogous domain-containing protein [Bacteroides sp.]